ncbi:hypothetical protein JD844_026401 [Phrynosoma platyrhinos]|uniref:HECT-type E3 ubiquitin transferase n=1 Tax=Phrynosoma platyrhinos TaxID=52577 RepID=A0ABQ7SES1_PHRPL|nr:hypothetical protein JD844_026401 [Phrynosoma platyrhinos]
MIVTEKTDWTLVASTTLVVHHWEPSNLNKETIYWDKVKVDLIPNGSTVAVSNRNKKDFVNKYVDYIFNKSVDEVFGEFRRGFYKVLDKKIVSLFEAEELMEATCGNANYDWDLYEKVGGGKSEFPV